MSECERLSFCFKKIRDETIVQFRRTIYFFFFLKIFNLNILYCPYVCVISCVGVHALYYNNMTFQTHFRGNDLRFYHQCPPPFPTSFHPYVSRLSLSLVFSI